MNYTVFPYKKLLPLFLPLFTISCAPEVKNEKPVFNQAKVKQQFIKANQQVVVKEADEMDYEECLEIQRPYLGKVRGYYTDWNPLKSIGGEKILKDVSDPWQFSNIRV